MYCQNCGRQVDDKANYCNSCGNYVKGDSSQDIFDNYDRPKNDNYEKANQQGQSSSSVGWGFLGFFIPIVGLILFLVWRQTRPADAKAALVGAITGFSISIFLNIFSQLYFMDYIYDWLDSVGTVA